jgi:hypothetical protein
MPGPGDDSDSNRPPNHRGILLNANLHWIFTSKVYLEIALRLPASFLTLLQKGMLITN